MNCKMCGGCCGIVPITEIEKQKIIKYCKNNNIKSNIKNKYTCKFLDDNNKCLIYAVRPFICANFSCSIDLKDLPKFNNILDYKCLINNIIL